VNILAIDAAVAKIGFAYVRRGEIRGGLLSFPLKSYRKRQPSAEASRWLDMESQFKELLKEARPDLIYMEGPSFSSKSRKHDIGIAAGILHMAALHELGLTINIVPPASIKKLVTGRGNATKDLVLIEAIKRLSFDGKTNDEADARGLLEFALHVHDHDARTSLPAGHVKALAQWRKRFGGQG